MITLSKVGGDVKIEIGSHSTHIPLWSRRNFVYDKTDPDNPKVNFYIGHISKNSVPLNELTIAGVVPTTEDEFDTQKATIFDEASGSTGRVVLLEDN